MVDQITDYLWISDLVKDEEFDERVPEEVDKVVNLSGYQGDKADLWYPLIDGSNDQKRFNGAVHNILKMIEKGETVLIHCAAGVSRSTGVGIAVMIEYEELTFNEADKIMREKRKQANPHPSINNHIKKYPYENTTVEGYDDRDN